jgi:molybdopterin/thiamine biosynthesis adenylyltransferase
VNFTVSVSQDLFESLHSHLFQADGDEHAAVILAGIHRGDDGIRLLARELHPVPAEHFVPGRMGYRQTTPRFVAELALRASASGLAYIALHSHPGADRRVSLSHDDLAAHRRLFPHLLNLTRGAPVAGIALGQQSAAGEAWLPGLPPMPLDALQVVGLALTGLTPQPSLGAIPDARFDRQVRLFGSAGQEILRQMHVAVVGAGGGGSMIVEQLAHLGVGRLTVIDFDVVKEVNLSRIVGSVPGDIGRKKIDVVARLVRSIDETIDFSGVDGDIADLHIAERLLSADFIFLATDTVTSRLVFNAIVHQYLIPGVQIGAKVDLTRDQKVAQVYVAVRPVLPSRGCLQCNSLIDPMQLQREARTDEERDAQNYLDDPEVVDPSVISLNGTAASHAVNAMLFAAMGLAQREAFEHRLFFPLSGDVLTVTPKQRPDCPFCSGDADSIYGLGDPSSRLPCRRTPLQYSRATRPPARLSLRDISRLARALWRRRISV